MTYDSKHKPSTLRVLDILSGTSVDGPGLRTTVYFAGCPHHCEGCHNPQSWDPDGGTEYTVDQLATVLLDEELPVTFSGGDPLLQPEPLTQLARKLKDHNVNIWCYTGYEFEYVASQPQYAELLGSLDVMVDGRFILSQRDTHILFRGSPNQRLVDVAQSLREHRVIEWESKF